MISPETTVETGCDEEYVLPSVDALMAGTLALMTGCAQADTSDPNRSLMARKLASNLFFLSEHPQVSPPMRCMLANLRIRWQHELERHPPSLRPPVPTPLWHAAPETVQ